MNECRIWCLYIRTDRRTKWQYSTFGGRWHSVEEAISVAKERMGNTPFEYRIECMDLREANDVVTGIINA